MSEPTSIPTISNELHLAFPSYMSSTTIELVAKNNGRFFVHKSILAHHSQPFKDATSGPWKESDEHKILLEDWDEATVGRLVQFLYTGDYRYPNPSLQEKTLASVTETETGPSAPVVHRSGTLTPFADSVHGASWEHPGLPMTDASWLETVNTAEFDFEETFLAHATVYTLAHYKLIVPLKALAYGRLSQTLLKLHPFGRNPHLAANITSLAMYVYANTDSLTNSEEPLRKIVSQYVALNFAAWQADPVAEQTMCDGGDLVKDVLRKICRRLGGAGLGAIRLAPALTRYIERFSASMRTVTPLEYIRELDSVTGKEKTDPQKIWLIPVYSTDPTKAATFFFVAQSGGLPVSAIQGQSCGSKCAIAIFRVPNARTGIVEIVIVRSRRHFLDLAMFPGFDGILSHTAHAEGDISFHFLWKSMGLPPADC